MTNSQRKIIENTREIIKKEFADEAVSHDWWHIERVTRAAMKIAKHVKCDKFVVEMAALLHDIDDWKFTSNEASNELTKTRKMLEELNVDTVESNNILTAIKNISFKYKDEQIHTIPDSIEGKIVQDADRLEAIGAIGIARVFAYGQKINQPLYVPESETIKTKSSIDHFYEKSLKLKDLMNTEYGKKKAEQRHKFLEKYIKQFLYEWEGIK